jgi:hypothetical protein
MWNATIKEIYYWCLLILTKPTSIHIALEFWYIYVYLHHASPYWQCTIGNPSTIHTTKNPKFIWGMALRLELSKFIQSIWNVKHFPLNATMQHNTKSLIWKLKPLDSSILNVILNNRRHVHLKPLKKTDFDVGIYYKFFFSSFPHSWPYSFHFAQPENILLRFSSTHFGNCFAT